MNWNSILQIVSVLSAIVAAIWGISQKLILENAKKQHQKELQKHKLSTEKEFSILYELWQSLDMLKNDTYKMRPAMDLWDENKSEVEIRKEREQNLSESYSTSAAIIQLNKPFYPEKIYDLCDKILTLVRKEHNEYRKAKRKEPDNYYEQAEDNIKELSTLIDKIESILREKYNSTH